MSIKLNHRPNGLAVDCWSPGVPPACPMRAGTILVANGGGGWEGIANPFRRSVTCQKEEFHVPASPTRARHPRRDRARRSPRLPGGEPLPAHARYLGGPV